MAEQSLPDYYIKLNNEYHRKKSSYDYLHYAMSYVDIENDDYTGPDFSAVWYGRNLKIYANILNEIEKSDEAILILFGSSHAHIFNYFFSEHPKFNTMHLEDVLNE